MIFLTLHLSSTILKIPNQNICVTIFQVVHIAGSWHLKFYTRDIQHYPKSLGNTTQFHQSSNSVSTFFLFLCINKSIFPQVTVCEYMTETLHIIIHIIWIIFSSLFNIVICPMEKTLLMLHLLLMMNRLWLILLSSLAVISLQFWFNSSMKQFNFLDALFTCCQTDGLG